MLKTLNNWHLLAETSMDASGQIFCHYITLNRLHTNPLQCQGEAEKEMVCSVLVQMS